MLFLAGTIWGRDSCKQSRMQVIHAEASDFTPVDTADCARTSPSRQTKAEKSVMHITDRTFIVTGGSSGLGLATCENLHSQGGYVAILDLNHESGEEAVTRLGSDRCIFFECDVSDSDSITTALKATSDWVGKTGKPIWGIVSAAGVGNPGKVL